MSGHCDPPEPSAGTRVADLVGAPFADSDDVIREAVAEVSVPALMMSMVHMSGGLDVLQGLPRPDMMVANELQGTMSADAMAVVRRRACDVIRDYRDRGCRRPFEPDAGQLREMLAVLTGSDVSDEDVASIAADLNLGGSDSDIPELRSAAADRQRFPVVVIGCGEAGLLAGIRLKQSGIPFTIVERQSGVGGTWLSNTYPGVRVDIANHYYSYSFEPNDHWTNFFSEGPDILKYLQDVMDRHGIESNVRFNTEVSSAVWHRDSDTWQVETLAADGTRETLSARALICAVGQFSQPVIPDIAGREDFAGPAFHTAAWDHGVDLSGKHVAVVGAGASGFQLVPAIAPDVAKVTVYQRTAQWMFPNPHYHETIGSGTRWALRHLPFYARWLRFVLWWPINDGAIDSVRIDPEWADDGRSVSQPNANLRDLFLAWITSQVHEPGLLEKVTPHYPVLGKRVLQDNGTWLAALQRDNVELVCDRIERITPDGVTTSDGTTRRADVLVWATGFDVNHQLGPLQITGSQGRDLNTVWGDDPAAYLGITVPEFPNFFCMYGPGTNAVNGVSIIYMSECQMHYIMGCLDLLIAENLSSLEPRTQVHADYRRRSQEAASEMVYTHPSVSSYYKNSAGSTPTLFPFRIIDYWRWTRRPNPDDLELHGRRHP